MALHKDGISLREIARRLNIGSPRTISAWIRGESGLLRKTKVDRSGEEAGLLVVIKEAPFNSASIRIKEAKLSGRQTYWICACKLCGREKIYTWDGIAQLRKKIERGHGRLRGCNWCELGTAIDYTDKVVGAWKAEQWRKIPNPIPSVNSQTLVEWLCKCTICNKTEKWIRASQLSSIERGASTNKSGYGVGCGCNTMPLRDYYQKYDRQVVSWYYDIKKRAEKDNLPFDLEPCDLAMIPDACPILGIPLTKKDSRRLRPTDNSPSVDRFIPELGYTKSNIHIISYRANRLKNNGTPEEWIKISEWCQRVYAGQKMK